MHMEEQFSYHSLNKISTLTGVAVCWVGTKVGRDVGSGVGFAVLFLRGLRLGN